MLLEWGSGIYVYPRSFRLVRLLKIGCQGIRSVSLWKLSTVARSFHWPAVLARVTQVYDLFIHMVQDSEHPVPTEPSCSPRAGDSQSSLSFMKLHVKWEPGCLETRYPYIFPLPRTFPGAELRSWKSTAWGWLSLFLGKLIEKWSSSTLIMTCLALFLFWDVLLHNVSVWIYG